MSLFLFPSFDSFVSDHTGVFTCRFGSQIRHRVAISPLEFSPVLLELSASTEVEPVGKRKLLGRTETVDHPKAHRRRVDENVFRVKVEDQHARRKDLFVKFREPHLQVPQHIGLGNVRAQVISSSLANVDTHNFLRRFLDLRKPPQSVDTQ